MPSTQDRDKAKRGIKARQDAIKSLIVAHQEEFDAMHARNRLDLGLPARPSGATPQELEDRIRKQKERLDKWEAELRLARR